MPVKIINSGEDEDFGIYVPRLDKDKKPLKDEGGNPLNTVYHLGPDLDNQERVVLTKHIWKNLPTELRLKISLISHDLFGVDNPFDKKDSELISCILEGRREIVDLIISIFRIRAKFQKGTPVNSDLWFHARHLFRTFNQFTEYIETAKHLRLSVYDKDPGDTEIIIITRRLLQNIWGFLNVTGSIMNSLSLSPEDKAVPEFMEKTFYGERAVRQTPIPGELFATLEVSSDPVQQLKLNLPIERRLQICLSPKLLREIGTPLPKKLSKEARSSIISDLNMQNIFFSDLSRALRIFKQSWNTFLGKYCLDAGFNTINGEPVNTIVTEYLTLISDLIDDSKILDKSFARTSTDSLSGLALFLGFIDETKEMVKTLR